MGNVGNSVDADTTEAPQFPHELLPRSSRFPVVTIDTLVINQHELAFTGWGSGNFDELVDIHERSRFREVPSQVIQLQSFDRIPPPVIEPQTLVRVKEEMAWVRGNYLHELWSLLNVTLHQANPKGVSKLTGEGFITVPCGEIHGMHEPIPLRVEPAQHAPLCYIESVPELDRLHVYLL